MTRPTCKDCRYWECRLDDQGPCRRHAPIPAIVDIGGLNIAGREWPETGSDEWCGEHKPIQAKVTTSTTTLIVNAGESIEDALVRQAYSEYEEPQT